MAAQNPRPELYEGLAITEGMLVPSDRALPPVPLKRTDVAATIVGPLCDVTLLQEFHNTHTTPIEALYVFPLPEDAAVSELTLTIGERIITGAIRERNAARKDYEQARDAGQGAALFEQHRPNLFGVSVANIQPNERVLVQMRFVQRLPFDDGGYEWVLPTTITPRYTPRSEGGNAPPQAPLLPEGARDGHTISIRVEIDSGALTDVLSPSHPIIVEQRRGGRATVTLQQASELPNRDFVLRYRASGSEHRAAVYTVREEGRPGTLLLTLLPQLDPAPAAVMPRELLFVLDRSGSMGGAPIVAARNALRACLRGLHNGDLFNIFPFDHAVEQFRSTSQPFTQESVDAADAYIATIEARGGTEILQALQTALAQPSNPERLRVIVFLTDGAVGDEERVLRELHHGLRDARVFAFGIGSAVNRYLLNKLAETGRGTVEYVYPGQDIEQAVLRFQNRAAFPLLTDIAVDWGGANVTNTTPTVLPDLYAGQPLTLLARFTHSGTTNVTLRGRTRQGPWQQTLPIEWPLATPERNEHWRALPQVWARARIDSLLTEGRNDAERGATVRAEVLRLALEHKLLSPYTSFVAIEERRDDHAHRAKAEAVAVPVYLPAGLNRYAFEPPAPGSHVVYAAAPMMTGGGARGVRRAGGAGMLGGLGGLVDAARGLLGGDGSAPSLGEGAVNYKSAPQNDERARGISLPGQPATAPEPSTRERLEAALRFLARTQAVDGSWAASEQATALAVLAFLAQGHTDKAGGYRPQLTRAVAWLTARANQPDVPPVVAWALGALSAVTQATAQRTAAQMAWVNGAQGSDPLNVDCVALAGQTLNLHTPRVELEALPQGGIDSLPALLALALRSLGDGRDPSAAQQLVAAKQRIGGDADGAVIPPNAQPAKPDALLLTATAVGALVWAQS